MIRRQNERFTTSSNKLLNRHIYSTRSEKTPVPPSLVSMPIFSRTSKKKNIFSLTKIIECANESYAEAETLHDDFLQFEFHFSTLDDKERKEGKFAFAINDVPAKS